MKDFVAIENYVPSPRDGNRLTGICRTEFLNLIRNAHKSLQPKPVSFGGSMNAHSVAQLFTSPSEKRIIHLDDAFTVLRNINKSASVHKGLEIDLSHLSCRHS